MPPTAPAATCRAVFLCTCPPTFLQPFFALPPATLQVLLPQGRHPRLHQGGACDRRCEIGFRDRCTGIGRELLHAQVGTGGSTWTPLLVLQYFQHTLPPSPLACGMGELYAVIHSPNCTGSVAAARPGLCTPLPGPQLAPLALPPLLLPRRAASVTSSPASRPPGPPCSALWVRGAGCGARGAGCGGFGGSIRRAGVGRGGSGH